MASFTKEEFEKLKFVPPQAKEEMIKNLRDPQITILKVTRIDFELFLRHNRWVTRLDLSGEKNFQSSDLWSFLEKNKIVTTLILSGAFYSFSFIDQLAKANLTVTTMDLSENRIGIDGIVDFTKFNRCVTTLDLSKNMIGGGWNRWKLERFIRDNTMITSLDLSGNPIDSNDVLVIVENNQTIVDLNLSSCWINDSGIYSILQYNKIVLRLNLSGNPRLSSGALVDFFAGNKVIVSLNIRGIEIGQRNFSTLIRTHGIITYLGIDSREGYPVIDKFLEKDRTLVVEGDHFPKKTRQLSRRNRATYPIGYWW